jgi:hypothetical protein
MKFRLLGIEHLAGGVTDHRPYIGLVVKVVGKL